MSQLCCERTVPEIQTCAISHFPVALTAEGKPDQVTESTGQETADFGGPTSESSTDRKSTFLVMLQT